MWLGGHTHTNPDDTYGGKSHIEQKWGVWFLKGRKMDPFSAPRNKATKAIAARAQAALHLPIVDRNRSAGDPRGRLRVSAFTQALSDLGWTETDAEARRPDPERSGGLGCPIALR